MTHDELKATINNLFDKGFDAEIKNALHAVVELHKPILLHTQRYSFVNTDTVSAPIASVLICENCSHKWENKDVIEYPCPTIHAITEKLG